VILAAHQPSYLPWLGYLAKIAAADVFVVMDDLQYEAQNFQNRNRLKSNQGAIWAQVPLLRGSRSDRIDEKRICNDGNPREHWQRRTWNMLRIHYGGAPHFDLYREALEDVYTRPWTSLLELDVHLLGLFLRWFEITRPVLRSSSLALTGMKTARILDLCKKTGARTYLSGRGGSVDYLDVQLLGDAGVEVAWQSFRHPTYSQRYPALGFVSHLSALDLLLNCGPSSADILRASMADEDGARDLQFKETGSA
jgi:hypothetical protein